VTFVVFVVLCCVVLLQVLVSFLWGCIGPKEVSGKIGSAGGSVAAVAFLIAGICGIIRSQGAWLHPKCRSSQGVRGCTPNAAQAVLRQGVGRALGWSCMLPVQMHLRVRERQWQAALRV
jgi:hypothetical protein